MNHPNCQVTGGMRSVCAAAERAARRNDSWTTKSSSVVHGVKGKKHRRVTRFNVTFGAGTVRLFLTSGGVVLHETHDGLVPVDLAQLGEYEWSAMRVALDQIGR